MQTALLFSRTPPEDVQGYSWPCTGELSLTMLWGLYGFLGTEPWLATLQTSTLLIILSLQCHQSKLLQRNVRLYLGNSKCTENEFILGRL